MAGRLDARAEVDRASAERAEAWIEEQILAAAREAVAISGREAEKELEAITRSVGGGRLAKAWTSRVYPPRGLAREPVVQIYPKGGKRTRGAMTFFASSGTIRPRGEILWIPLPSARRRSRVPDLTPRAWESSNFGIKLRRLDRPGKPPLLVIDARGKTGAAGRRGLIPVFIGLRIVSFSGRFSIQPTIAAARGRLTHNFRRAANARGF